jgi:16S rRNA processing protein RimM
VGPARLEVGRIARAHGLRGEVLVELTTNRSERVDVGSVLLAEDRSLTVLRSTPHQERWIVAFEGVESREAADGLRGRTLSAEPIEDPEALWVHDLVGSRLVDQEGADRGEIVAVESNPASDLAVLDGGGLVPLRFVTWREPAGPEGPGIVRAEIPTGLLD